MLILETLGRSWSQSQRGTLHLGQFATHSQGWYTETDKHSCSKFRNIFTKNTVNTFWNLFYLYIFSAFRADRYHCIHKKIFLCHPTVPLRKLNHDQMPGVHFSSQNEKQVTVHCKTIWLVGSKEQKKREERKVEKKRNLSSFWYLAVNFCPLQLSCRLLTIRGIPDVSFFNCWMYYNMSFRISVLKNLNCNQAYSWWSLLSVLCLSPRADEEVTAWLPGWWSGNI